MVNCFSAESSVELFQTNKGTAYQCDVTNRIIVKFDTALLGFRIHDFLNFRRLLNKIDITGKLFDLSDECDYQVIEAPQANFQQRLTLCELIQLRELVNGTYFVIELNSLLHKHAILPGGLFRKKPIKQS